MDSKSELKKDYKHLFFLDEGKLRKIIDTVKLYAEKKDYEFDLYYEINLADNSQYKENDLLRVLGDENVKGKEIIKLSIYLKKVDKEYSWRDNFICQVHFNKSAAPSKYDNPMSSAIIDEDKNWSYGLAEELDIYMKRTIIGEKYEFGRIIKFIDQFVPYSLLIGIFIILKTYFPLLNTNLGEIPAMQIVFAFSILFPILLIITITAYEGQVFIIQYLLSSFKENNSTFYWGDQIEHFNKTKQLKNNIKWVVIIGFCVSLIAGLVTAILLK